MKAFVQTHSDGNFINANYFEAWRGLSHLGYDVETFKIHEITDIALTKETPVYASVAMTREAFRLLNVKHDDLPSYPSCLRSYLNRGIVSTELKAPRAFIKTFDCSFFIKPLDKNRKLFCGEVFNKDNINELQNLDGSLEVYVSNVLDFQSEYRVFIQEGKILDSRKYRGDVRKNLDYDIVEAAIRDLSAAYVQYTPVAYCLDFGVDEYDRTTLVEATDSWAFGYYGLEMEKYANMIVNRWNQIVFRL